MADQTQTNQNQTAARAKTVAEIVVDKNKSQEQYIKDIEHLYIVPGLIREKFPDLIKLIFETESMNNEEREYWLQIMPIMTEDQIVKFREILVNEKEQLSKLDQEYQNEMSRMPQNMPAKEINEEELKGKITAIKQAEIEHNKSETANEEEILKKLNDL